jgi:hypothetical protein
MNIFHSFATTIIIYASLIPHETPLKSVEQTNVVSTQNSYPYTLGIPSPNAIQSTSSHPEALVRHAMLLGARTPCYAP